MDMMLWHWENSFHFDSILLHYKRWQQNQTHQARQRHRARIQLRCDLVGTLEIPKSNYPCQNNPFTGMKSTENFQHSSPKSPAKPFMCVNDSHSLYILSWVAMNLFLFHLIFTRLIAHAKPPYNFPPKSWGSGMYKGKRIGLCLTSHWLKKMKEKENGL